MFDIRLARPDDAEAIHLILQETWGESLLFDVFRNHISSIEHQIFVAVDAGEIVGFLWKPLAFRFVANVPETVHLIPADTLTYRGLWIEGFSESQLSQQAQRDVIRIAQSRIFDEDRLNTGMFIPDDLKDVIASDLLTSATNHGQYHRWQYAFK